jgi:O-antigen ligase
MLLTLGLSLLSVAWPLPFVRGTENGPSNNHFVFRDHIAQNLMMSFFALVMAIRARFHSIGGKRLLYWALAILSIIDILFFVLGRTGYVSLALNAMVFWFFLESARQRIAVAISVALIAIMTLQLSSGFRDRIDLAIQEYQEHEKKELSSVGQRIEFIKKGMQLILERPVTGFGTGSYKTEFCRVADSPEWCTAGGFHPHNQFIAFGVQLGLVGIMAYLIWLAVSLKQALRLPLESKILGVGLLATLMVDSMFHAPLFLVAESAFFMLMLPLFMADVSQRT